MTRERAFKLATDMGFMGLFAVRIADVIMNAVAEEREACAKIADYYRYLNGEGPGYYCACGCIADDIRGRGAQNTETDATLEAKV